MKLIKPLTSIGLLEKKVWLSFGVWVCLAILDYGSGSVSMVKIIMGFICQWKCSVLTKLYKYTVQNMHRGHGVCLGCQCAMTTDL